ncbi:hypothetical protein HUG15_18640 [Salicibibacter cibarius]|uniref:Uncharacterized protein n=1 Tax=Salicibibacter cibarius TaxID=2743000 RepID=A0A7T6Z5K8_9BACI|nr:hypothetical protein [Salicibibacter cibarius]QQK77398.1 hypothetical protein HUG15_18640 [Salicibibacter cibarius]
MKRKIGNVGVLNLLNTTEENLNDIEWIGNVGVVMVRKGKGDILQKINIGNIGSVIEVEEGYQLIQGGLTITQQYLEQLVEPLRAVVLGALFIEKDVHGETFLERVKDIQLQGAAMVPNEIRGTIESKIGDVQGAVIGYDKMPKMFSGSHTLSKQTLESFETVTSILGNGVIRFADDVEANDVNNHIDQLYMNGVVILRAHLEPAVRKALSSEGNPVFEIIPNGYAYIEKTLKVTRNMLKRFSHQKLYTDAPMIFTAEITRGELIENINNIHTESYIVCPEHLEDLLLERCDLLETEIISFENEYLLVEGEEIWNNETLLSLDEPISLIVDGILIFSADVTKEAIYQAISQIGNFDKIIVEDKQLLLHVKRLIEVDNGKITSDTKESEGTGNIGTLTL